MALLGGAPLGNAGMLGIPFPADQLEKAVMNKVADQQNQAANQQDPESDFPRQQGDRIGRERERANGSVMDAEPDAELPELTFNNRTHLSAGRFEDKTPDETNTLDQDKAQN